MKDNTGKKIHLVTHFLSLFLPFCLWLFMFRGVLSDKIHFGGDTARYFHWVSYFFDNMQHGVFPLWNPFQAWGCVDNLTMRSLSEYNPFIYMIPLLRSLGISSYVSFLSFMVIYVWVGAIGFYLITYKIFKNAQIALMAYAIFLFSGYGLHFFNFNFMDALIFVLIIWFFYFFMCFWENPQPKYLLGITLVLMLAASTYIPIAFMLNVVILLMFLSIFYINRIIPLAKKFILFFSGNKVLLIFCIFSVLLSTVPLLMWRAASADPQYIVDMGRQMQNSQDVAETSQKSVDAASIPAMVHFRDLFDNLDISRQIMPFVSIFLYIALVLTLFTQMDRFSYVMAGSFCLLFVISSGSVFPLQPWFFEKLKIFRLYRNYCHFFPELCALAILFLMSRLQKLHHAHPSNRSSKILYSFWGVLSFAGILFFLLQFDHIIISSYLTVVFTLIVFFLWIWKKNVSIRIFFLIMTIIALIQPLEFYCLIMPQIGHGATSHPVTKPQFSFSRPQKGSGFNETHGMLYRIKLARDESGFPKEGFYGVKYVQDLHQHVPESFLQEYIQHKFYLYQNWKAVSSSSEPWEILQQTLADPTAPALIFEQNAPSPPKGVPEERIVITEESSLLRVDSFTVNHISLTVMLPHQMLLVYNDSFHHEWRCEVDGVPAPILRVNYAFKGIILSAGKHKIKFVFGKPISHIFPWILLAVTAIVWILTIGVFMKDRHVEEN